MDKLLRDKRIWLAVFISSVSLSVLGAALSFLFAYKLLYIPFILALVFAMQGFYLAPFSMVAYLNRRRIECIISVAGEGRELGDPEIADELSLSPEFVNKMLAIARKKKYI